MNINMRNRNINILCVLAIMLFSNIGLCQNNSNLKNKKNKSRLILSTDIYALYPCLLFNQHNNNKAVFNYGLGGMLTLRNERAMWSLGFNYWTNNYSFVWYYWNSDYLYLSDYRVSFFNIPISLSFSLFNKDFKKKNDFIIGGGIIFSIPVNYKVNYSFNHYDPYHSLPSPNPFIVPKSELGTAKSFQLLLRYQRRLNKIFDFYIGGFINYKFSLEYKYTPSPMTSQRPYFDEQRLILGLSTGIEIFFRR
jgi:hypothetical protein